MTKDPTWHAIHAKFVDEAYAKKLLNHFVNTCLDVNYTNVELCDVELVPESGCDVELTWSYRLGKSEWAVSLGILICPFIECDNYYPILKRADDLVKAGEYPYFVVLAVGWGSKPIEQVRKVFEHMGTPIIFASEFTK